MSKERNKTKGEERRGEGRGRFERKAKFLPFGAAGASPEVP